MPRARLGPEPLLGLKARGHPRGSGEGLALPEAWEVVTPSLGQRAESDYSPEARDKGDPKARGELGKNLRGKHSTLTHTIQGFKPAQQTTLYPHGPQARLQSVQLHQDLGYTYAPPP